MQCFYCGEPVACGKKRKKYDVASVRTIKTKDTILAICQERGDSWANAVQGRLLHVHDLCAADAVYHRACSTNFRTMKQLPAIHEQELDRATKKVKLGRPLEKERAKAFVDVCKYLEKNDNEQITIDDLIQHYGRNSCRYRAQCLFLHTHATETQGNLWKQDTCD